MKNASQRSTFLRLRSMIAPKFSSLVTFHFILISFQFSRKFQANFHTELVTDESHTLFDRSIFNSWFQLISKKLSMRIMTKEIITKKKIIGSEENWLWKLNSHVFNTFCVPGNAFNVFSTFGGRFKRLANEAKAHQSFRNSFAYSRFIQCLINTRKGEIGIW